MLNLEQVVNPQISKKDLLDIIEENLRQEIETERKTLKAQWETVKSEKNKLSILREELFEKEKNRLEVILKPVLDITVNPVELNLIEDTSSNKLRFHLVKKSEHTIESIDSSRMSFSISWPTNYLGSFFPMMGGRNGGGQNKDLLFLEVKVSKEFLRALKKHNTLCKIIEQQSEVLYEKDKKYENELWKLRETVEQFSVEITKEVLNSVPQGQELLEKIHKLSADFRARYLGSPLQIEDHDVEDDDDDA